MRRPSRSPLTLYLSLLGAVALLIASVCAVWFAGRGARVESAAAPRYLLRDDAGRLALYAADGSGPLAQYPVLTRLLPEKDLLALQEGVLVTDEEDLQKKLEDYGL